MRAKGKSLIAATVVLAPVLAIGNGIALTLTVAIAIHAIRRTVMFSIICAPISVRNLVSNAGG